MQPGDLVADRFLIERAAGSGGMGQVYRALDRTTGNAVAVKVLLSGRAIHRPRFEQEAVMLAELNHPGIVRYVAHGGKPSGEAYLVTEWLDGESLSDRLRRQRMTPGEGLTLGLHVARALDAAHQHGILHRDLKPSNLFLVNGAFEKVKLLDFGLARRIIGGLSLTGSGTAVGTPGYMAPEQARGVRDIDARVDVFSLGCVLFKCLTGRRAFAGQHALAILMRIILEDTPSVSAITPTIPVAFDELIARMLSKSPADRPHDAGAVAAELEALSADEAITITSQALSSIAREPVHPPYSSVSTLGNGAPEPLTGISDDGERRSRSSSAVDTPELTSVEQRVLCLVLTRGVIGIGPDETELDEEDAAPRSLTGAAGDEVSVTIREGSPRGRILRAEVDRHEGNLMVLADGSVVVVLSNDGPPTDLAARAARCALAIQGLLPNVLAAIVSGRGVVSERLPVGEIIDRGVALLDIASPMMIRIDDVTAALLDSRFDVTAETDGLILRAEREGVDAARPLLGRPTVCVGRERELGTLEAIFAECVAEPVARAVLVTGAAGVGKSRVRAELMRKLQRRGEAFTIWSAHGDPRSAGSSFALLARLIRGACGILEGEPLTERRRKVVARVAKRTEPESRARVAEFLGELAGAPFPEDHGDELWEARRDAMLMGDQMRRAWEDFLIAECAAQPVLIVLEDLHWGDLPTVKAIEASLRNLRDYPLMVLALGRPEVLDLFPRMWAERAAQEIRLGALPRRASEQLVRQVLGAQASAETVARLVDRADGNAFYLEELIRVVAGGGAEALPETVLAMVQVRLDGLAPEARRVLRAASVFGETFWPGGVAALLGGQKRIDEVDAQLVALRDLEVISRRVPGRFPAQDELVFRHAMLAEGAYAMLTEGDRELGHRLAGEWLQAVGEEDPMVLAEHFELGGNAARAVPWYRRAAEQALEGNDLEAVLRRTERGCACGAAGEQLGMLRLLQAEAHRWRGEHEKAAARSLEAMQHLPRGGARWYLATGESVIAAGNLGDLDRVLAVAQALRDEAPGADSRVSWSSGGPRSAETRTHEARAIAIARAATQLLFAGRRELAGALLTQIDVELDRRPRDSGATPRSGKDGERQISTHSGGDGERRSPTHSGDFAVAARVQSARAWQAMVEGAPERHLRLSEAAAASFEHAGDLRNACRERVIVGAAYLELGAHAEAERALEGALAGAQRMGLPTVTAAANSTLGVALARQGRFDQALAVERAAVDAFRRHGGARMEITSRANLAKIYAASGDLETAEREARAAVAVAEAVLPARAGAMAVLSSILLDRGRVAEALSAAQESARTGAMPRAPQPGDALLALVHARALRAAGDEAGCGVVITAARERLLTRAATIEDPQLRASFLEQVPENVATMALGGPVPPAPCP